MHSFCSIGSIFFKKASQNLILGSAIFFNHSLLLGFFFYGVGLALMVLALKHGSLSQLYPIISLNFVWVALISFFVLKETISISKASGISIIIFGVFMIQKGEAK
jgi:drug/metabolite transporter (DMT)-like permease